MNELLQLAKRKKVQDLLSLEIRKLETEWINLKDKEATPGAAGDTAAAASTSATPVAGSSTHNKRYQIKLNGYGK